jgi:NADPH:quinone reductase-like Zn-dependent oxidoreductase
MKAAVRDRYGPPEILRILEIEKPRPGRNELLIRVHASTVNRTDCGILRGEPFILRFFTGLRRPAKCITGTEFAGEVEAVGQDVRVFRPGDRVFGFNDSGMASNAAYLVCSEEGTLALIPNEISYELAAASLEGAHYAYNFLRKVNIGDGARVLVNGATGAIGSAMVQLLKHFGAEITAVCRGEHFDLIRNLGASRLIDYTADDFTGIDDTFPFIFDAVGKSTFGKCRHLLAKGGVYISSELGPWAQNPILAVFTRVFGNRKVKFPIPTDIKGSIAFIAKLMDQGEFAPLLDRRYTLEEIADAYRYVETGQKVGNVVISHVPAEIPGPQYSGQEV